MLCSSSILLRSLRSTTIELHHNAAASKMSKFQERLKQAMGARGYENCMRRSVQTVILYEANRCIVEKLPSLRPFQRKLAFLDQALALVEEMGLMPHHQAEIMWRTGTSKEPMQPDTAWKRMKLIEKDMEKLAEKMKPLCVDDKDHDEVCKEYIQSQYETVSGQQGKPYPVNWEHAHNNLLMAYRMYYKGAALDPDFPAAEPPKEIVVPATKPDKVADQAFYIAMSPGGGGTGAKNSRKEKDAVAEMIEPSHERLSLIEEVRDHLTLLKDFEGVVPADTLNKRKRELFAALPAAPPSVKRRIAELVEVAQV